MSSNFNKVIEQRLSLTNCSLLSEVTDVNDLSFSMNKHVRFDAHTNDYSNNNISFLNSSVVSDASLLDSESKLCKITIDTLFDSQNTMNNGILQDSSNCAGYKGHMNSPLTISDYKTVDEYTTIESQTHGNDDNTSIWSSETDVSNDDSCTHSDSIITSTPRNNLFQVIDRMPSTTSDNSSSPAETVVSDNVSDSGSLENDYIVADFSVPRPNTSKKLKNKIESLTADLNYHTTNVSSTAKELAVKKLKEQLQMKDKYNDNNSCAFASRTPVHLTKPLNIRQSVELYPDLTAIDVRNESILAAQQRKLAAIRKRVGADKMPQKFEDGLSEPDLLEFFEPNKHLYKSVNLSTGSHLINLKPTLTLADRRLYSVFRNRDLLNKFE